MPTCFKSSADNLSPIALAYGVAFRTEARVIIVFNNDINLLFIDI